MQNTIVNVNGQILGRNEAKVSVFDRGYLYGDSLYEVVRTYQGKFFAMKEHLERLRGSAHLARMVLGQPLEQYEREMLRTLDAFRKTSGNEGKEAYCRIIISRGEGKIGFGLPSLLTPTLFTIIVQPIEPVSKEQYQKGMKLQIPPRLRNDRRALDPAMKSGNYLNSVLAYLEANADGFDDAILVNHENHVTEGTTFNVFYFRRGILATPPLDIGILEGITRRHIFKIADELGIPYREVRFTPERLYEADEVFLSGSVKEIFPVTQIDEHRIGKGAQKGQPGPMTLRLREEFQKHVLRSI